jgi:5-(carboxyamino)imidazole ribonucleotide synthase
LDGSFANWGVIENGHRNHILDVSVAPASVDERIARQATEITRTVLEKLDVIGLLCVEFFLTKPATC